MVSFRVQEGHAGRARQALKKGKEKEVVKMLYQEKEVAYIVATRVLEENNLTYSEEEVEEVVTIIANNINDIDSYIIHYCGELSYVDGVVEALQFLMY